MTSLWPGVPDTFDGRELLRLRQLGAPLDVLTAHQDLYLSGSDHIHTDPTCVSGLTPAHLMVGTTFQTLRPCSRCGDLNPAWGDVATQFRSVLRADEDLRYAQFLLRQPGRVHGQLDDAVLTLVPTVLNAHTRFATTTTTSTPQFTSWIEQYAPTLQTRLDGLSHVVATGWRGRPRPELGHELALVDVAALRKRYGVTEPKEVALVRRGLVIWPTLHVDPEMQWAVVRAPRPHTPPAWQTHFSRSLLRYAGPVAGDEMDPALWKVFTALMSTSGTDPAVAVATARAVLA